LTLQVHLQIPIEIDIRKGLPWIREQWILDRNDVEELTEISLNMENPVWMTKVRSLAFWIFTQTHAQKKVPMYPNCIMPNKALITPEMEYIAIRENQKYE
jgi:phosphomethylpyrimidine synthase